MEAIEIVQSKLFGQQELNNNCYPIAIGKDASGEILSLGRLSMLTHEFASKGALKIEDFEILIVWLYHMIYKSVKLLFKS